MSVFVGHMIPAATIQLALQCESSQKQHFNGHGSSPTALYLLAQAVEPTNHSSPFSTPTPPASASHGSSLEIQNLRPHPRTTELESAV